VSLCGDEEREGSFDKKGFPCCFVCCRCSDGRDGAFLSRIKKLLPAIIGEAHPIYFCFGAPTCRVGQNRMYALYMTVCLMISLPKTPYIHRKHMVLANPTKALSGCSAQSRPSTMSQQLVRRCRRSCSAKSTASALQGCWGADTAGG